LAVILARRRASFLAKRGNDSLMLLADGTR
jgi:hypothetical protein